MNEEELKYVLQLLDNGSEKVFEVRVFNRIMFNFNYSS